MVAGWKLSSADFTAYQLVNQMKKLIAMILEKCGKVRRIYVGSVLPRADREVELENDVKDMNRWFAVAVQQLKRHQHVGGCVVFVALHRIFLERFHYCDLLTGLMASMIRIVRPLDRYFVAGTPKLNLVGKYHIKSYLLQHTGVLDGVNSWTGMGTVEEHPDLQRQKKMAWLKAQAGDLRRVEDATSQVTDEEAETDLEDELAVPDSLEELVTLGGTACDEVAIVVETSTEGWSQISSQVASHSASSGQDLEVHVRVWQLVIVQGRHREPFDTNLDFDDTV